MVQEGIRARLKLMGSIIEEVVEIEAAIETIIVDMVTEMEEGTSEEEALE